MIGPVSEGFGYLAITSAMDSAEIFVDGKFHGNAPASLKLAAGSHVVLLHVVGGVPIGWFALRRHFGVIAATIAVC